MALDASAVVVGVTGNLYVAPTGTAAPADAATALPAEWVDLGFISADGITETPTDDVSEITAWQNATVVRKTTTKSEVAWSLALIETNQDVLELYFKGSQFDVEGKKISDVGAASDQRSFVIDVIDGTQIHRRYIPLGEVTERAEQTITSEDAVAWGITITAYPSGGRRVDHMFSEALPVD